LILAKVGHTTFVLYTVDMLKHRQCGTVTIIAIKNTTMSRFP